MGGFGSGPAQFDHPTALAVDGGRLYVVDRGNGRVVVLDAANGAPVMTIGSAGQGVGQLSLPRHLALTPDGILVSDSGNGRIVEVQCLALFLGIAFPEALQDEDEFVRPRLHVSLDDGHPGSQQVAGGTSWVVEALMRLQGLPKCPVGGRAEDQALVGEIQVDLPKPPHGAGSRGHAPVRLHVSLSCLPCEW